LSQEIASPPAAARNDIFILGAAEGAGTVRLHGKTGLALRPVSVGVMDG
jgi:hypothetical protein